MSAKEVIKTGMTSLFFYREVRYLTREELIEKVKLLPYAPGVYMMKDKNEKIIYVGKSKSLRNRVSSYFQEPERLNVKTAKLVEHICDFTCVYTDTETEALILENELIKRHNPKYNIKLKDAKSYPYVKITNSEYPHIMLSRTRKNDKGKYFGPYTSSKAVTDIIETVRKTFKIASCGKKFYEGKSVCRPCLNYHIGKCCAPCTGNISSQEYKSIMSEAEDFLKGDYIRILHNLREKMQKASDELKFEAAAQYRDRIAALEKLNENQKIVSSLDNDRDVFGVYEGETLCVIAVLFIRAGRLIDKEQIFFSPDELSDDEAMCDLLMRYYQNREYIPKSLLLSFDVGHERLKSISEYLNSKSERRVEVSVPQKGVKHDLTNLACENARQAALQYSENVNRNIKVLIHLGELLGIDSVPSRIEAYDISNHGTQSMYAGMIVVEDGNFKKKDYRSFAIKTVSGIDDYSAMREAISRRIDRYKSAVGEQGADESFSALPDLILIDGGIGHLSVVKPVIDSSELPVAVFGMIKDSFHKTRTLTDGENEIDIAKIQDIFTFIYKIQEEVHRYTFSRMDSSRRKNVKKSSLEEIKGVGKSRAKDIMKHFKTLSAVKKASVEELTAVKGINTDTAKNIVNYFRGNK